MIYLYEFDVSGLGDRGLFLHRTVVDAAFGMGSVLMMWKTGLQEREIDGDENRTHSIRVRM